MKSRLSMLVIVSTIIFSLSSANAEDRDPASYNWRWTDEYSVSVGYLHRF